MEYINRRGQTYFAFEGKTKTGKPKYYASKKPTSEKGSRIDELPIDFEFHEKPANATVTIRRRKKSRITVAEKNLLERLCLEFASPDCQVAIEKDDLVVYAAQTSSLPGAFGGMFPPGIESLIQQSQNFDPELKFSLVDGPQRKFDVARYCYRGTVDGWMPLHRPSNDLEPLARAFLPHLGEESFYELF